MPTERKMNKQKDMAPLPHHTHNETLCSSGKDQNSDTYYKVDESWKHYAKRNESDTEGKMDASSYARFLE
jgi:hypothetical protein